MVVCETLPLCRDTTLSDSKPTALTEPIEVGPYREGIVFVKATETTGGAAASVGVGISPTGYEDWDEHWVVSETRAVESTGMHAIDVANFGNWLRLRFALDEAAGDGDELTLLAWFVGKG